MLRPLPVIRLIAIVIVIILVIKYYKFLPYLITIFMLSLPQSPPTDKVYKDLLEYSVSDSVPSCKILHKYYYEDGTRFLSAIYQVDSCDFLIIKKKFQEFGYDENKRPKQIYNENNFFMFEKTIEFLAKENIVLDEITIYITERALITKMIGLKPPDIIIYEEKKMSDAD